MLEQGEYVWTTLNLSPFRQCCGGSTPHAVCRFGSGRSLPYARRCEAPKFAFHACPYADLAHYASTALHSQTEDAS